MSQQSSVETQQLQQLSRKLQELLSLVLRVERTFDPSLTGTALLDRLINDSAWAWIRPLSALLADVDHVLDLKESPSMDEYAVVAAHIRGLIFGEGDLHNHAFLTRYRSLLQLDPELVSAHGELKKLLRDAPLEPENESERLHARHQWTMKLKHKADRT